MIRSFFKIVFRLLYGFSAVIGFGLIVFSLTLYFTLSKLGLGSITSAPKPLTHDSVLTLTLNGPYVEHEESLGFERILMGKNASLYNLTRAIIHAAHDPKVKGIVA